MTRKHAKRLKPTGHSAVIESMIQPAIVIGSTLMSAIAAYVLALDEITRILAGEGQPSDWFIVTLCAGMGFLIDMAIIVSATRYKMHAVRGDPRELRWLTLAKWVLGIGLASETLTLFYFFVHLSARAFPIPLIQLADLIHSVLAVIRAFLPPVVIAYFAAGVLPVMFDRADRNREIKSRTSSNIMLLIDRLSEVFDTDDKAEMLRALGGQLMLDTYATYDETGRTSEDGQLRRDAKLLTHLARIHRLDWSEIAADVAPEMSITLDRPQRGDGPDTPPEDDPDPTSGKRRTRPENNGRDATRSNIQAIPSNTSAVAASTSGTQDTRPAARQKPAKASRTDAGMSQEEREKLREARLTAAQKILDADPKASARVLASRIAMATHHRISVATAQQIRTLLLQRATQSKTAEVARIAAEANN